MSSVIPGANRAMNPDTMRPMEDAKGRPMWNMPRPTGQVRTMQLRKVITLVDGKPKQVYQPELVTFPVYRGIDTKYARFMRSQVKRGMAGKVTYPQGRKIMPAEPKKLEFDL